MAKFINYNLCTRVNHGTEENPVWREVLLPAKIGWSETNEELVRREAHNGEYTIEDDGLPEPTSTEDRVTNLEEALDLLLSGVTE